MAESRPADQVLKMGFLYSCKEIVIDFAFVLLRTLEKYSQSQEYIHVRKKKNRRRQKREWVQSSVERGMLILRLISIRRNDRCRTGRV